MTSLKTKLEELQQIAKERTVRAVTVEYDLETLVKKINKNIIRLNPDYQRRHRWDVKTASKLIESLILNIPIPFVYISQDIDVDEEIDDGVARYSVIDGQQRLTAVTDFFNKEFQLEELEALEPLNGCSYSDLPPFLVRRLEERTIRCLRIDSTLDQQVKFDIFERLNSGSVKLEPQELRNATCRGRFREAINKAANNETFLRLAHISEGSAKRKKMEDVELVLRYFALTTAEGYEAYRGKFKQFLTDKMKEFNELPQEKTQALMEEFRLVIALIDKNTDKPFAKYKVNTETGKLEEMSKFNAAVFDSVMAMSRKAFLTGSPINFDEFVNLFNDKEFFEACQGSVNDVSKVRVRIMKALALV
ncbi:DUF262 domain-containing protein [Agarivorans litoreus]|uniref:DUF262 domain-containing protein n=1 Tax=Agarivorans litoreus TaxID=1510455 RepID=UPI001C7DE436|nr:DUF262 domain-containing protein [Agarivorans litoreus]